MPSDETLDDGQETCDGLVLADETVRVAHYVGHRPRIENKGHVRPDCLQLVSECDARRSTEHVVRKNEGHRHSLHNCEGSGASRCREN